MPVKKKKHITTKWSRLRLIALIATGVVCTTLIALTLTALPASLKKKVLRAPICDRCNVVVISLDTLSGLHLPCYGYPKNTAPNLCGFAKRNTYFTNASSQSYFTLPSHMSLFTSQYPSTHGMLEAGTSQLPQSSVTLAETLKSAGYATLYYGPIDSEYLPLNRGFARGFTYIDAEYDYEREYGLDNWKRGIDKLDENRKKGEPTFLFLHTYYVHQPYLPGTRPFHFSNDSNQKIPATKDEYFSFTPEFMEFTKRFFRQNPPMTQNLSSLFSKYMATDNHETARRLYNDLTSGDCKNYCLEAEYFYTQQKDNPRDVAYMKALYDELIFQLDTQLSDILAQLQPMLSHDTILVVTSDHGEEFMEHGDLMHRSLYGGVLRVPLILSVPQAHPKVIHQPVGIIDIYPTIVGLLGLPNIRSLEGQDLSDAVMGLPTLRLFRPVISEYYNSFNPKNTSVPLRQRAITTSRWKMYLRSLDGTSSSDIELYDVVNDPWDTTNVADKHPFVVWYLKQIHHKFNSGRTLSYPQNTAESLPLPTPEQQQRLFHY